MRASIRAVMAGAALACAVSTAPARADMRYDHERFYEGLAELHQARALLAGAPSGSAGETARQYVERAIDLFHHSCMLMDEAAIKRYDREPAPVASETPQAAEGRALGLLRQARLDILAGGFDPFTAGVQRHSLEQINLATGALGPNRPGA